MGYAPVALTRSRRDVQRWARRGSTTARGYGSPHQAERERRLLRYRPGDICPHCGQPILYWPLPVARRYIDLPHAPGKAGYLPGLAHRSCNRRDGQRMTTAILNARQGTAPRAWQASRQW
jgi:hypothetical protein